MAATLVHQQVAGLDMEGCGMNQDDDTDAGGDFFIDLVKTMIALFIFVLFVAVIGSLVWRLVA
jgi:hypothetical protein